ncbi:MAG: DUF362 domain-containing protein [Candidatus Omnitrophota bacterium]|nr:DUF362 domain-containing protein [Candidatus Omnitrophota bacterium]
MENRSKVFLKRIDDWSSSEDINNTLVSLWGALQAEEPTPKIEKDDFVALKLTFGERETSNYIKSNWLTNLIENLKTRTENLFIIETNTLYREKRSNAVGHLNVAREHGYNTEKLGIPIIIGDGLQGRNSETVSIRGAHLENVKLAKGICESDVLISLAHVTGHMQTGFAGSLKNIGMGCASRAGKLIQHSKTLPEVIIEKCTGCGECMKICPANAIGIKKKKAILVKERCIGCGECTVACRFGAIRIKYDEFVVKMQEKMVEYALGVKNVFGPSLSCMNFLYNITKNCDCMSKEETPITSDVGIIAGRDTVAVDKASLDLIGIDTFKEIFPEIDPMIQIQHAEKIKLGSSQYDLTEL